MWRRREQGDADAPVRDETFPYLTERQAGTIRALARTAFAERGVEVTVHADHLSSEELQYGLTNLCASCFGDERGEEAWLSVVEAHVTRILASTRTSPLSDLDAQEVLSRTFLRLYDINGLPAEGRSWFRYGRPVVGDMVELLALDAPETSTFLRDEDVATFGATRLREAGLANLLAERPDRYEVLQGPGGLDVHVVTGESVYLASKLLVFRDVLRRTLGDTPVPDGVLVVAPFRHQLAFVPVESATILRAPAVLARFALTGFTEGVAPLSPHVHWWTPEDLVQVSSLNAAGDPLIHGDGAFGRVVERLLVEE